MAALNNCVAVIIAEQIRAAFVDNMVLQLFDQHRQDNTATVLR
jgi:CRISPR/Cas system-associated endonuclease Cas1